MIDVQALAGSEDFEELVFDGPDAFVPTAPEPAAEPTPATGRKRIARNAAKTAPPEITAVPIAEPAPTSAPQPAAAPTPAATPPARIALAAPALGLLAALLSAAGLLMATRTIAHADMAARSAEQERALLAGVPASLARLDQVIAREQAGLARLADGRAGQPATIGDIHRELDGLRLALDRHQPQQDLKTIQIIQSGQGEIAGRLGGMADVLDRLDRASRAAK